MVGVWVRLNIFSICNSFFTTGTSTPFLYSKYRGISIYGGLRPYLAEHTLLIRLYTYYNKILQFCHFYKRKQKKLKNFYISFNFILYVSNVFWAVEGYWEHFWTNTRKLKKLFKYRLIYWFLGHSNSDSNINKNPIVVANIRWRSGPLSSD